MLFLFLFFSRDQFLRSFVEREGAVPEKKCIRNELSGNRLHFLFFWGIDDVCDAAL
jgi:hypothetical protein